MALMDCPECGHRISDKAFACPHCGYPLAPIRGSGTGPWPGIVAGVAGSWISARMLVQIILGIVVMICFGAIMITMITSLG